MISGIYKITCLVNGKFYYGISQNIEKRIKQHKYSLINKTNYANKKMQLDFDKYGIENFEFKELIKCDMRNAKFIESVLIQSTRSYEFGYNTSKGFIEFINDFKDGLIFLEKEGQLTETFLSEMGEYAPIDKTKKEFGKFVNFNKIER